MILTTCLRSERCRDSLGNLPPVKTTVLDKDLVGVHPRNYHARKVDTPAFTFERYGICLRLPGVRLKSDARSVQEREVWTVACHRYNKVIHYGTFTFGRP